MKKSVWVILIAVFLISAAGFVYTYVQPRYTASIVRVGMSSTVTNYTKHGRRTHSVVPLTAVYTDENNEQQLVNVDYIRPAETLSAGQQIVITRSFNGFINYPFTGLRWFSGAVGGAIGLFLLLMWIDKPRSRSKSKENPDESVPRGADSCEKGGTDP